jgi:hypothetical protein
MKWALPAFAIFVSMAFCRPASAETASQMVKLTVVSLCASIMLEKAELNTDDGRRIVDMPLTRINSVFYAGHAAVAPGRYFVGATARSKCWGGTKITVLHGHDRDVGIQVTPLGSGHYDAQAFLYGALPFGGFVAGALVGKGFEDTVEIDHGAYYVEHAQPGSYLLKLSYGDSLECRIPVVIPNQGMRLDIGVKLAQNCLGFPYQNPGTGKLGFIPLFPSPSPSP